MFVVTSRSLGRIKMMQFRNNVMCCKKTQPSRENNKFPLKLLQCEHFHDILQKVLIFPSPRKLKKGFLFQSYNTAKR
jgi:hypothetical protein